MSKTSPRRLYIMDPIEKTAGAELVVEFESLEVEPA
jgi:hypothetical protein